LGTQKGARVRKRKEWTVEAEWGMRRREVSEGEAESIKYKASPMKGSIPKSKKTKGTHSPQKKKTNPPKSTKPMVESQPHPRSSYIFLYTFQSSLSFLSYPILSYPILWHVGYLNHHRNRNRTPRDCTSDWNKPIEVQKHRNKGCVRQIVSWR